MSLNITQVPPDEPLMAAGLDSLGAVELRNLLQESLDIRLPSTVVIDYPTITALASYITQQLVGAFATAAVAGPVPSAPPRAAGVPAAAAAATLGGLLLPSGALLVLAAAERTPATPVASVAEGAAGVVGVDMIGMVPLQRWDVESPASSSTAAR